MELLGLFLKNCSAWVIAEQACYRQGAVTIPLYDTFGAETLEYIIQQTKLETILCSTKELALLAQVSKTCPSLKTIIVADACHLGAATAATAAIRGTLLRLMMWDDVVRSGEVNAASVPPRPPAPSDVATICYTSGTTGKPKGAIISHQNLVAVSAAGLESTMHVHDQDVYLSFLPLPHIFERIVVNSLLARGAAIGFYRGDPLKIIEDVTALKPTIFCAVPRLYNRIYDKISHKVTHQVGLSGQMLRLAVRAKLTNLRQHGQVGHSVWDGVVFDKIKASLGLQRVRLMLTGGAPMPSSTMEFFRILLGPQCSCHEGYGQTETTGATSLTSRGDLQMAHCGGPVPCCEIKLVDVPEMSYLHTDTLHDGMPCLGRGEIWVRGPGVIRGYYLDEDETKEAGLDGSYGNPGSGKCWLRSGDIGMWLPGGQLSIIDRKKNMFKMSQGEYVAAEKIEGVFSQTSLVAQMYVYGDSHESQLVAIVVPDEDAAAAWFAQANVGVDWTLPQFGRAILDGMTLAGRAGGLKGFELVYAVHVDRQPWTPENDLLTPTMKLKRANLTKKYKDEIARMYYGLNREKESGTRARL